MHDLVGAYERFNRVYGQYIESAFPLRYSSMGIERRELLSSSTVLSQPPLLEPTPVYPSSALTLAEASAALPPEYHDLHKLAQELMSKDIRLYRHQWKSLEAVLKDGKDLVVTTGTGSGKTECFLLPILAELARESLNWPKSSDRPPGKKWWEHNGSEWQSQWEHTGRNAKGMHAVRALVLYPLNALVEDQLRRLRRTLDSDEIHRWLDLERGGNRVTFGRYTGQTPVSGNLSSSAALERLRARLRIIAAESEAVRSDPDMADEVRYYFPDIDGGEMWSRWDMQDTPPDILITNYSMLNIMLMRSIEAGIFRKTREWLEADPSNKFFLVVDELHSYRGTPGTEVAYILRLLLHRLGLSIDSEQLVILSTSASVADDKESRKFLREFFGRDKFEVIVESQIQPDTTALKNLITFQSAFEDFAQKVQPNTLKPMEPPSLESDECIQAMIELATVLGSTEAEVTDPAQALSEALLSENVKADDAIRSACFVSDENGEHEIRPTKVPYLDRRLFGGLDDSLKISDAMRGLLLALGMSRKAFDNTSPQPVRGHFFFHNVQNLWACANPKCDGALHAKSISTSDSPGPIGALHAEHRLTCTCGGRVLDLIVCEVCGDIFLGGYRSAVQVGGSSVEILTADLPDIADMPNRMFSGQQHGKYAVFWPVKGIEPNAEPADIQYRHNGIERRWVPAKLSVYSGELRRGTIRSSQESVDGWAYVVSGTDADGQPALSPKCPRCDADYRRRRRHQTPLRVHRTGFQKACQVIAGALAREMPPKDGKENPSRKLVIFSDSRQDAAKLASGMEQDHYRDMVRILLLKAMREYWGSFEAALRTACIRLPNSAHKITDINPRLGGAISKIQQHEDHALASQFDETLNNQLLQWLVGMISTNNEAFNLLMTMIEDYPGRVPLTAIRDKIKLEMLSMGFNPGGNGYQVSQYRDSGRQYDWHNCYDWEQPVPQERPQLSPGANRLMQKIDDSLMSELMFTLFQHTARTLEGLGAGWVTYKSQEDTDTEVVQATESVIRMLGIRRRYTGQEYFHGEDDIPISGINLPGYIRKYLGTLGIPEESVVNQLRASKIGLMGNNGLGLDPNYLYVVRGPDGSTSGQKTGLCCPRCSAFYLHPTGRTSICPDCLDEYLVEGKTQEDFDYYIYLAEQSGQPFRLHCEELTGQTDDAERPKRQRWFQEVFVSDEKSPRASTRRRPAKCNNHHGSRCRHRGTSGSDDGKYAAQTLQLPATSR